MIENKIRVISNWKPANARESEAMRSLVMTEMGMRHQPTNTREPMSSVSPSGNIMGTPRKFK